MHSAEHIKLQLLAEGYVIIEEYNDAAGEYFTDHNHNGDQRVTVLEGEIVVNIGGVAHQVTPDNPLYIPAKVMHDVTVGETGCKYIVGEKKS